MNLSFYDLKGKEFKAPDIKEVRFRPGVYVFVVNSNNEVLTILDEKSNQWEFPGGGLELGEELFEGAIREVKEETGYHILVNDKMPFHIQKEMACYSGQQKFVHGLNFFYHGRLKKEEQGTQNFAEGENILEVKFVPIDSLKNLDLVLFQKKALQVFLESIKHSLNEHKKHHI